jgi:ATP-dependent DNA helicase RecG
MNIDLKELSKRESERVEWKEQVADIDDIIKTAVAFANDYSNLGGGYIVCGAKEIKDEHGFQKLLTVGLTASRLKEIEGKATSALREKTFPSIVPVIEEIEIDPEHRILVFVVAATGQVHTYRATGKDASTCYVRTGRETREARNGIHRELLVKRNLLEAWDKRSCSNATIRDIDLIALRQYLQEINLWDDNKSIDEYYFSDTAKIADFIPPLVSKEQLTDILRPRNFTLLIFGRDILRFFNEAYTILSKYPGVDRSEPTAIRHEITGNIIYQARRCIELLEAETYMVFDKNSAKPNRRKYPAKALQEAIVNAIVHKDYEIQQPVRITVFSDRIEFYSPGGLPRTVDVDKFKAGKATPVWRNQALAYFFNKLQLAQAEGQGIPTIIRSMQEEDCPAPVFETGIESLTCILPAHPRAL